MTASREPHACMCDLAGWAGIVDCPLFSECCLVVEACEVWIGSRGVVE